MALTSHPDLTPADAPYLKRLTDVSINPVFILGDHRSGTTLLYQTLANSQCFNFLQAYHIIQYDELLHNHIHQLTAQKHQALWDQFEELGIRDRVFDQVPVSPDLPEEYGFVLRNSGHQPYINRDNFSVFLEACRKVQFLAENTKPLLLKNPWCYPYFCHLAEFLPQARFIFIHRHPVHVINSKLKAVDTVLSAWNPYTGLISKRYHKIFKNPLNRLIFRVMYAKRFNLGVNKTLKQSQISTQYFLANLDQIARDRYVSIRFEDLCDRPTATIQQIFDFLQLTPNYPTDYAKHIQKRPVKLLPTVAKNQQRIYRTLQPYF